MDEEEIIFLLYLYYWAKRKNRKRSAKHRHSITDASQSSSGTAASVGDVSPTSSAILSQRTNITDVYTSTLWTSPMCLRIFTLGVSHRMFADCCALLSAVWQYIIDGSWRRNIGRKCLTMSRCLGEAWRLLAYTSLIILRITDAWWRCSGDGQICSLRKHREA